MRIAFRPSSLRSNPLQCGHRVVQQSSLEEDQAGKEDVREGLGTLLDEKRGGGVFAYG